MGTRSHIGYVNDLGMVIESYCGFDSYDNLKILKNHYNTLDKVKELVARGDMKGLEETIDKIVFSGPMENETNTGEWQDVNDFLEHCQEDYTFLFQDGKWLWRRWDHPELLS